MTTNNQATKVGKCCSYPQGHVSFLPQLLGAVAVILSMLPLALNRVLEFACIEYDIELSKYYTCFPLVLTDPDYWLDKDSEGFARAVQVGTVAASVALLIGGIGWVFLLSAICFPLDPPKIRSIWIAFAVASVFSVLTLVALNINVCKAVDDDLNCKKQEIHLAAGANMEILAAVFYFAACFPLCFYSAYAKRAARAAVDQTQGETQLLEKEPFLVQMNHVSDHRASASLSASHHGDEIVASVLKPSANAKLGLSLRNSSKSGVVVKGIAPDSALATTALKTDMIILRINDQPVTSVEQAYLLLQAAVGRVKFVARPRKTSKTHEDFDV